MTKRPFINPQTPPPTNRPKPPVVKAQVGNRVRATSKSSGLEIEGVCIERRRTVDERTLVIVRDDAGSDWKFYPWEVHVL